MAANTQLRAFPLLETIRFTTPRDAEEEISQFGSRHGYALIRLRSKSKTAKLPKFIFVVTGEAHSIREKTVPNNAIVLPG